MSPRQLTSMGKAAAVPGFGPVVAALAAAALLTGCGNAGSRESRANAGTPVVIGLVTSLPIFWREAQDPGELLANNAPPHWALDVLRERGSVRPLDTLAAADGRLPLARSAILLLAQPYPLSPRENVALDDWVRGGGRVLLFADPMLTRESGYALGDRRRQQDIVLLSPILARWGLDLQFDDSQPAGEWQAELAGEAIPVNLPGRFARVPGSRDCSLEAAGLLADCRIGRGHVVALADAAVLEDSPGTATAPRRKMLKLLLDRLGK